MEVHEMHIIKIGVYADNGDILFEYRRVVKVGLDALNIPLPGLAADGVCLFGIHLHTNSLPAATVDDADAPQITWASD